MSVIFAKKILYQDKPLELSLSEDNSMISISVYTRGWTKDQFQAIETNIKKKKQDHIWYIDYSKVLLQDVLLFVYHEEQKVHRSLEDVFLLLLNAAFPGYKKYKGKPKGSP